MTTQTMHPTTTYTSPDAEIRRADAAAPLEWLAAGVRALVGCAALGAARARGRP